VATHQRETPDERFALNLRILREREGLSQSALAEAMSERKHAWHQQTVAKVEAAARPLRLAEAADLADILRTTLDRLLWTGPEANAAEALYSASGKVRRSAAAVTEAVLRLLIARDGARRTIDTVGCHDSPRVASAREDALGSLAEGELDSAVAEGIARRKELTEAAEGDGT
jgi:transcriptional regulator with XRE-family HTH domain